MDREHERCINCDEHTGKAGIDEDSLYINGVGPFCEECYDEIGIDQLRSRVEELESEIKYVREDVEKDTRARIRCISDYSQKITELEAKLAERAEDTERLNKLDEEPEEVDALDYRGHHRYHHRWEIIGEDGADIRAAIDAAMGEV